MARGQRVEASPWMREWLAGEAADAFGVLARGVEVEAGRSLSGHYVRVRVALVDWAGPGDGVLAAARRLAERVAGRRLTWVPSPWGLRGYAGRLHVATVRLADGAVTIDFYD